MNQFLQVCASAALAAVGVGAGWWMRSSNPSDATRHTGASTDVARELTAIRDALEELVRTSHHDEGIVAPSQEDRTAVGAPDVAPLSRRIDHLIQLLEASPQAIPARGAGSRGSAFDAGPQREHLDSLERITTAFSEAESRTNESNPTAYTDWCTRYQRAFRCMPLERLIELFGVPDDAVGDHGKISVTYHASDGRTSYGIGFDVVGGYVTRCSCDDLNIPAQGR